MPDINSDIRDAVCLGDSANVNNKMADEYSFDEDI